jgi:non-ribosomal peptide synthetase component E (peptide arylation enzyme)
MFPFNSRSAWLDQSVFSRFTSCAQHAPDAIAVLEPTGRTLSYASILRQARAIAYAVDQRTEHNEAVAIAISAR